MKRSLTTLFIALGLTFGASAALNTAVAADAGTATGTPGAAMDQSLHDQGDEKGTTKKHHHKRHRTHKPAHSSGPASEESKTNGKTHHHHHHKDAEKSEGAGASAPAGETGETK